MILNIYLSDKLYKKKILLLIRNKIKIIIIPVQTEENLKMWIDYNL